jgi:hypothetical protein
VNGGEFHKPGDPKRIDALAAVSRRMKQAGCATSGDLVDKVVASFDDAAGVGADVQHLGDAA